jgi:DNA-binding beta-propeller fold protein YncE
VTELSYGGAEVTRPPVHRIPPRWLRGNRRGYLRLALGTTLFGVVILAAPTIAAQGIPVAQFPGHSPSDGSDAHPRVLTSCRLPGTPGFSVYDPANGYIYAISESTGSTRSVTVLEAPCTLVGYVRIPGLSFSWLGGAAYDPQTKEIYVTDPPDFEVYVIRDLSLVRTIPVPFDDNWAAGPGPIAYDPATGDLLAANVYDNVVNVLSGTSFLTTFNQTSDPDASPDAVLVLPNDDAYFANSWGGVAVVNATTYQPVRVVPVGPVPEGLAWAPSAHRLYVGFGNCSGAAGVADIDTTSNTVTRTTVLPKMTCPVGLGYSPKTQQVFVTEEYGNLLWTVSSSGSSTSVQFFQGSGSGTGVTFDPGTSIMYVCGPHRMYVVS